MEPRMRSLPTLRRAVVVVAATALGVGLLTACSHVGADTGNAGTKTTGQTANQKAAAAKIAAASGKPTFTANPSFDMGSLKGKKVLILTSTNAVPFVANIAKGAAEAAAAVGWTTTSVDGKGSVTEWSRVVSQAVSQKVDGIITVGASPSQFKPAVASAKAAGIPLVDVLTADQEKDPLIDGTFSHVSISFYDSGALQADYVIANGAPDAHVLVLGDNEFPGEVTRVQGMKDEFAKLCPKCSVTVQDTQVANLGTTLQTTTQTLLRRDPKIKWVMPTYDGQGLYVVAGIKAAGLASTVKVVGSDAVASNLDLIKKGDVQVADVGEPDIQSGWAGVDMLGRALAGQSPVKPNIPLRVFTKDNLEGVDTADTGALFGDTFRADYKKVWGIS
jgi:ribose transport system substrate-binding protein